MVKQKTKKVAKSTKVKEVATTVEYTPVDIGALVDEQIRIATKKLYKQIDEACDLANKELYELSNILRGRK
jgi:hypothetical protein